MCFHIYYVSFIEFSSQIRNHLRCIYGNIIKLNSNIRILREGDKLNQLKKIDLIFFTILSIVAEFITAFSFSNLKSGFYFSFAIMIYIIFSIRWGNIAIVSLILSGLPLIFIQPIGNIQSIEIWKGILYYMIANATAALPMLIYGKRSRNKIVSSPLWLAGYVLVVFLSIAIGKEIALLIISQDPLGGVKYFLSEIFILVITILVLLILSRLKTKLVYDMHEFFKEEEIVIKDDYIKQIQEKGESETDGQNSNETI